MNSGSQAGAFRAGAVCAAAILIVAVIATIAAAQQQESEPADLRHAKLYADCMTLARGDPQKALGFAADWARSGGDEGARHCRAVALLNSGKYAEAAEEMESLAATTQRPGKVIKADLLAQAGQAWMIFGDAERAIRAQTRALEIGGPNVEIFVDRAVARAGLGDYWAAIDDLNEAIDQDSGHVQALILRSTAWRKLKNLDLASDDIDRALTISPADRDALLERGNIRALRGDVSGAVGDWRRVVKQAPESIAAQAAKENLAKQNQAKP